MRCAIGEAGKTAQQGFRERRCFVIEAPRHRHGVVENEPAHRRPSSINALIVRPPSVTPLRNSRMRSPAARARSRLEAGSFVSSGIWTAFSSRLAV